MADYCSRAYGALPTGKDASPTDHDASRAKSSRTRTYKWIDFWTHWRRAGLSSDMNLVESDLSRSSPSPGTSLRT